MIAPYEAAKVGDVSALRKLIAAGADVSVANGTNGEAPLHAAAAAGHHECVRLLCSAGVDGNAKEDRQRTALFMAARRGRLACVRILLASGVDVNTPNCIRPPLEARL